MHKLNKAVEKDGEKIRARSVSSEGPPALGTAATNGKHDARILKRANKNSESLKDFGLGFVNDMQGGKSDISHDIKSKKQIEKSLKESGRYEDDGIPDSEHTR